jgi:hypothetical protein
MELRNKNVSVNEIQPGPKIKKIFTTSRKSKNILNDKRTLKDIMFDTENGVPMRSNEEFSDQVDITGKMYSDTPHTSMLDKGRSRQNSANNNIIDIGKKDFLGQKRENEESQMSRRSVKPQIIIENGIIRLERPNYIEIKKKVNEDIRMINEKNPVSVDMTNEKARLSSMSFRKKTHSDKWNDEETDHFYKSLAYFGTDFSLLEIILKPRNRNQIKNKFHKEEKTNKEKIEETLKSFKAENIEKFFIFIKELKRRKKKYEEINFKKLIEHNFNWDDEFFNKIQRNEEKNDLSDNYEDEENQSENEEIEDDENNVTVSDNL